MKHKRSLFLILLIVALALPIGVTFSKYVITSVKDYVIEANRFFFNSDKLTDDNKVYHINNWSGMTAIDIGFSLNNHKNNALSGDDDITYDVRLEYDDSLLSCNGSDVSGTILTTEISDDFQYTFTPLIAFNDNESVEITIIAQSHLPYEKTLSATFIVTVGQRGISYSISDEEISPYLMFSITNALEGYKVGTAFSGYTLGQALTPLEFQALSPENQDKCYSALVTLTFNPADVILDTTSEILSSATTSTTLYNGINYISTITFKVDPVSSTAIRFYKNDVTNDYTYNGTGTPIITFSAV